MKLRASRIHEVGGSNADFRPQHHLQHSNMSRLDYLSVHTSPQNFSSVVKQKSTRAAAHPIELANSFYKMNDLQLKEKSILRSPFASHLEEKDKLKLFNGDSTLRESIVKEYGYVKPKRKPSKQELQVEGIEKLAKEKHEVHGRAIAETQLVGLKQRDTLEGKIDLENIREIRKSLRRRYANRKNFQKIFSAWDSDGSGSISVTKMMDMLEKMHIKINFNEARVLIASADEHMSGKLNLSQFMYLIFNSNEALNVDLKKLPVLSDDEIEGELQQARVVELLAGDIVKSKQSQKDKQLNLILKNRLEQITNQILQQDSLSSGYIPFEKLELAMKKVGLPESVMNKQDLKNIYNSYKKDEHRFDYKKFINFLKGYHFMIEDLYKPEEEAGVFMKQNAEQNMLLHKKILSMEQPVNILDAQSENSWSMEGIRRKANKVFKTIDRYFSSREEFESVLKKQIQPEKADGEQLQVSKQQLTKFFKDLFLTVGEKDVTQGDLEGMLSALTYNKQGYTVIAEICPIIYQESDNQWVTRMQWKQNRPPPPDKVRFDDRFPCKNDQVIDSAEQTLTRNGWKQKKEEEQNIFKQPSLQNSLYQSQQMTKNASAFNLETYPKQGQINQQQAQLTIGSPNNLGQSPSTKSQLIDNNNSRYARSQSPAKLWTQSSTIYNKKGIKQILEKIENRVFMGTTKAQEVFRSFDRDHDGYVSQKDLVRKIKELNVLENSEITPFLNYVDPQRKGFVDFAEFSSKIRSGMTVQTDSGRDIAPPTILPAAENNAQNKQMLPTIKTQIEQFRASFRPEFLVEQPRNTRFGASPDFKNTFKNIEISPTSPMFCSNKERFDASLNHRIMFQKVEKAQQQASINNRIQRIRANNLSISSKIEHQNQRQELQHQQKIESKGYKQWAYQHRADLLNDWS